MKKHYYYLAIAAFCISFTKAHTMQRRDITELKTISRLELTPGKGLVDVVLPFQYYSPTKTELNGTRYIREGCFTVLEQPGECALVGPLKPCQLITLSNNGKTVVGHLVSNANLETLLSQTKNEFSPATLGQTTGTIFTTTDISYDDPLYDFGGISFSEKDLYQGRSQLDELKKSKNAILAQFNISNDTQINTHIFTSPQENEALGDYTFADLYTFVPHTGKEHVIYSMCPMAEKFFGDFGNRPLSKRQTAVRRQVSILTRSNPYFKQFGPEEQTEYGKFPFVKI